MNIRDNDETVAPISFLWAAYLPHRYFFEVLAISFVEEDCLRVPFKINFTVSFYFRWVTSKSKPRGGQYLGSTSGIHALPIVADRVTAIEISPHVVKFSTDSDDSAGWLWILPDLAPTLAIPSPTNSTSVGCRMHKASPVDRAARVYHPGQR